MRLQLPRSINIIRALNPEQLQLSHSCVYLAYDSERERQIIVKSNWHNPARSLHELHFLLKLDTIGAAKPLGGYFARNCSSLFLQYYQCPSLRDLLQQAHLNAVTVAKVAQLGLQLAELIPQFHSRDCAHSDLKAAHLLPTAAGLRIIDFDMAKPCASPAVNINPRLPAPLRAKIDSAASADYYHCLQILHDAIVLSTANQQRPSYAELMLAPAFSYNCTSAQVILDMTQKSINWRQLQINCKKLATSG